mmetsp:Transcript_12907/g.23932  ORF Transcript_12907/g.23932 Transcript_12907/m.23932 type:complete len:1015 (+) Transcript_12907:187-3231(+)
MSPTASRLREFVRQGDHNGVEEIVKQGASAMGDPLALDGDGLSVMHLAAERGDVIMLEILHKVAKVPVGVRDSRGGEPILEAAASGKLDCIRWLVDHGVDVNTSDDRGDTALHLAAGFGHIETMSWLLKSGAAVDSRTKIKVTPLLYATAKGRLDAIRLLLDKGAAATAVDDERGWNAAHTAAGCNQNEALKLLINHIPSLLWSKTRDGKTPSHVAMDERCPETYLTCMELSKLSRKPSKKSRKVGKENESSFIDAEAYRLADEKARQLELELEKELAQQNQKEKNQPGPKRKKKKAKCATKNGKRLAVQASASEVYSPEPTKQERSEEKICHQTKEETQEKKNKEQEEEEKEHCESKAVHDSDHDMDPRTRSESCRQLSSSDATISVQASSAFESESCDGEWVQVSRRAKRKASAHTRSKRSTSQVSCGAHSYKSCGSSGSSGSKSASDNNSGRNSVRKSKGLIVFEAGAEIKSPTATTSKRTKPSLTLDVAALASATADGLLTSPSKRNTSRWTLGNPKYTAASRTNDEDSQQNTMGYRSSDHPEESGEQVQAQSTTTQHQHDKHVNEDGTANKDDGGSEATKSRLRPHATPWSPRRRRWTSPAANAGQVKAKVLVEHEPEVVDNEFQRMLKKFVHMDVGARRTAKRKFAKATAEYEEKRLADAEQMEQSWRASIKLRLERGILNFKFADVQTTLDEISEAAEARKLHDCNESRSSQDEDDVLADDPGLMELVEKANKLLEQKEHAPLEKVSKTWRSGVLVLVPDSESDVLEVDDKQDPTSEFAGGNDVDGTVSFDRQLRHSVETWRLNDQYQCVWLRFTSEQCHLIPVAVRLGFDFEHARPGYVIMKLSFPSCQSTGQTPHSTQHSAEQSNAIISTDETVRVIVIKRVSGGLRKCQVLLMKTPVGDMHDDEQDWSVPLQPVLSGEDPMLVAESLVREISGFAVSPHKLEEASNIYFCSVLVDEEDEKDIFAPGNRNDGLTWCDLTGLHQVLDANQIQKCTRLVGSNPGTLP